ncbi:type II toxin-antitoxin system HipA family toxin [Reichenbachiella agariperforans]|uniref:type II toxin-antitoxin system HipA family toxin n=1 Tax=Reichenbachiella agariperforans TaxID=156994 RepID=UPI001C08527F|nr:type II toxin-antitoxin system HipA family toxin [Reichenbachiella agariperforans]MBU2915960.1 type II toxin-antitoxin system HipA family toxin [Reichenbachiella agariperforans]
MVTIATVKIWDTEVGAVAWDENQGVGAFEYAPKFIQKNWELAPLKMPLPGGQRVFIFPELRKPRDSEHDTFKGMPGLLADALPDKYGNQLINAWLAKNGRPANSMNPVEQLCFIGSRGMGALEFVPSQFAQDSSTFKVEMDSLVDVARKMLSSREDFQTSLSAGEEKAMRDILKIGTSAGGARPKALIAYNPKTGDVRSGQTKVPKGYEHWLIKLDGVSDEQFGESSGYGRIEYAYYQMAIACGIEMSPSQLYQENGRAHFMTSRFDREENTKHHIQTWCAMNHFDFNEVNSFSYEQLFQTMRQLRLSYPAAEEMYKRMVFNVIARNCDDHSKNFAFRLKKDQKWELTPAYDICHAYRPDSVWVSQHALSVNGKRNNISRDDLLQVGKSMNIKRAKVIIENINETVKKWPEFAEAQKVNITQRDNIQSTLHIL